MVRRGFALPLAAFSQDLDKAHGKVLGRSFGGSGPGLVVGCESRGEHVEESSHEDVRGGRRVAVVVGHERLSVLRTDCGSTLWNTKIDAESSR